jgi:hypothetical protein
LIGESHDKPPRNSNRSVATQSIATVRLRQSRPASRSRFGAGADLPGRRQSRSHSAKACPRAACRGDAAEIELELGEVDLPIGGQIGLWSVLSGYRFIGVRLPVRKVGSCSFRAVCVKRMIKVILPTFPMSAARCRSDPFGHSRTSKNSGPGQAGLAGRRRTGFIRASDR